MSAEELRELADWLAADDYAAQDRYRAADYLRACADAMEAGPVAWEHNGFVSTNKGRVEHDEMKNRSCGFKAKPIIALYPLAMPAVPDDALRAENERLIAAIKSLAMPAQAQALRLPEPMTDEEVAALIAETEYLPTDHAVRYLVETGECRVKEANE